MHVRKEPSSEGSKLDARPRSAAPLALLVPAAFLSKQHHAFHDATLSFALVLAGIAAFGSELD